MECNTFCRTNVIGLVIAVFGAVIYVAGFFSPFWSFKATTDVSEGYKQFSEGIWMWCFKGERQAPIEDISVCKWYGVSAQPTWFHFARFFECLGMLGFLIIISYISTIQCPIRFLRCHRFLEIVSLLTGVAGFVGCMVYVGMRPRKDATDRSNEFFFIEPSSESLISFCTSRSCVYHWSLYAAIFGSITAVFASAIICCSNNVNSHETCVGDSKSVSSHDGADGRQADENSYWMPRNTEYAGKCHDDERDSVHIDLNGVDDFDNSRQSQSKANVYRKSSKKYSHHGHDGNQFSHGSSYDKCGDGLTRSDERQFGARLSDRQCSEETLNDRGQRLIYSNRRLHSDDLENVEQSCHKSIPSNYAGNNASCNSTNSVSDSRYLVRNVCAETYITASDHGETIDGHVQGQRQPLRTVVNGKDFPTIKGMQSDV